MNDVLEKPTILVVDDSPETLSLISGLLKDLYKLKVANNGDQTIKIAHGEKKSDLILLDVMMPGLSGYDVCEVKGGSYYPRYPDYFAHCNDWSR